MNKKILIFLLSFVLFVPTSWGFGSTLLDIAATQYMKGNIKLPQEVECMTKVVFFEARGESLRGKQLVAEVVLNRTNFGKPFRNTICGVVYQPHQFSWTLNKNKKQLKLNKIIQIYGKNEEKSVKESVKIGIFYSLFKPKVGHKATHFSSANDTFRDTKFVAKVGNHTFYSLRKQK